MKSNVMWFVHHFIRILWSFPIGLISAIIYLLCYLFNQKTRIKYKITKTKFWSITIIAKYIFWVMNNYTYKWDLLYGLFDHDSWAIEWFIGFGDCDSIALWSMKKLKKLGVESFRIGVIGKKFKSWHYDTIWCKNGIYYLMNYGRVIDGLSISECIDKLDYYFITKEGDKLFPKGKTKYWICKW